MSTPIPNGGEIGMQSAATSEFLSGAGRRFLLADGRDGLAQINRQMTRRSDAPAQAPLPGKKHRMVMAPLST